MVPFLSHSPFEIFSVRFVSPFTESFLELLVEVDYSL